MIEEDKVSLAQQRAELVAKAVLPGAGGCRDDGCDIHGGPLFDDDGARTP